MHTDTIREAQRAQPFKPFALHLADGRQFSVPHPEFVYLPPKNLREVIVTDQNGITRIINLMLVVSLEPVSPKGRNGHGSNGESKRKR
jgi:hypothetical protein